MSEQNIVHLNELLIDTKDGDWGEGVPTDGHMEVHVIRGTDFPEARVGRVKGVPRRFFPERTAYRRILAPDDILIETAGGTRDRPTGRTLLVTERLLELFPGKVSCASFARFLRVDSNRANPHYIFWHLQNMHNSGAMWEHQIQHTGVARFQYTRFAATEQIKLPSMAAQEAIAGVLGALDDKIAVNERIAATAISLGEAMYRDAAESAEDSVPLGDLIELRYGKSLPASRRDPGVVPVYGSGGVSGRHSLPLVTGPGVVVGRKGTVGAVYWSEGDFYPIDTTYYVVPKKEVISMEYAYFALQGLGLQHMNSDSAVPGLNRSNALAAQLKSPSALALSSFTSRARQLFELKHKHDEESLTLASLRDTLLPQLLSGKLRVKDAEAIVEDAV